MEPSATPPPTESITSPSGVPSSISLTPGLTTSPTTVHTCVPGDSSVPIERNQSAPRRRIVGTTAMASDVQRQYFEHPNAFVWNHDMDQIQQAGLNMLRSGWWSGWDDLVDNGVATEKTLRTEESTRPNSSRMRPSLI